VNNNDDVLRFSLECPGYWAISGKLSQKFCRRSFRAFLLFCLSFLIFLGELNMPLRWYLLETFSSVLRIERLIQKEE
jgi:hypothetical protein